MTTLSAIILFLIFLSLSGIHVYWAFGGQWYTGAVIPTKDDNEKVIMPGFVPTLIVALGLFGFGLVALMHLAEPGADFPAWLSTIRKYGLWAIAVIFTIRAIGDFKYLGFFKKHKHTKFAINDTRYYSPLCLLVGTLAIFLLV
jgi:uncharacterized membrane protein YpjA